MTKKLKHFRGNTGVHNCDSKKKVGGDNKVQSYKKDILYIVCIFKGCFEMMSRNGNLICLKTNRYSSLLPLVFRFSSRARQITNLST